MFLRRVAASVVGAMISGKKSPVRHFGKQCHQCRRMDHFAAKCKSAVKERSVRVVDAENDEEVFTLSGVSEIDAAQIVTLQLDSRNYLRFQIGSVYSPDRSALQRRLAIAPTSRLSNADWL